MFYIYLRFGVLIFWTERNLRTQRKALRAGQDKKPTCNMGSRIQTQVTLVEGKSPHYCTTPAQLASPMPVQMRHTLHLQVNFSSLKNLSTREENILVHKLIHATSKIYSDDCMFRYPLSFTIQKPPHFN